MRTFLWAAAGVDVLVLLLIAGARLERYELSEFQARQKLLEYSGEKLRSFKRFHKNLQLIQSLQKMVLVMLGAILVALLTHLVKPPALGFLYVLVTLFVVAILIKLQVIEILSRKVFEANRDFIVKVVESTRPILQLFSTSKAQQAHLPESKEEFVDVLRRIPSTTLSPLERQRLELVLSSEQKTVKDIMTPKKRVVVVEPSATLGPIVLSDLQKSGHGYFPVAAKKGEPEGILTLSDVTDLEAAKQRGSVHELMSLHVAWVEEETSLLELAGAFLEEKQYAILVRNNEGEFCGLVTISDLMKHLVGVVRD